MTVKEFEDYLVSLSDDEYDALIADRISRLDTEQQKIMLAREEVRKYRHQLIKKLNNPDPDVQEQVFNALMNMDTDACEHGRSFCKSCIACGEMDHAMFPELFDEYGDHLSDDVEENPETD